MENTTAIDLKINLYLSKLNEHQKKTVLTVVKEFANEQEDWWNKISDLQKEAIDFSIAEMKNDNLIPHKEVMKKYSKWLKK